jgi:hypothetical protein
LHVTLGRRIRVSISFATRSRCKLLWCRTSMPSGGCPSFAAKAAQCSAREHLYSRGSIRQ